MFIQSLFAAALDALTTPLPGPPRLDSGAAVDAEAGPPGPLVDAGGPAPGVPAAEPRPPALPVPSQERPGNAEALAGQPHVSPHTVLTSVAADPHSRPGPASLKGAVDTVSSGPNVEPGLWEETVGPEAVVSNGEPLATLGGSALAAVSCAPNANAGLQQGALAPGAAMSNGEQVAGWDRSALAAVPCGPSTDAGLQEGAVAPVAVVSNGEQVAGWDRSALAAVSCRPNADAGLQPGELAPIAVVGNGGQGAGWDRSALGLECRVAVAGMDPEGALGKPPAEPAMEARTCNGAVRSEEDASVVLDDLDWFGSPRFSLSNSAQGSGGNGMQAGDTCSSPPSFLTLIRLSGNAANLGTHQTASRVYRPNGPILGVSSPLRTLCTSEPQMLDGLTSSWGDPTRGLGPAATLPLPILQMPLQLTQHASNAAGHEEQPSAPHQLHVAPLGNAHGAAAEPEGEASPPGPDYLADLLASDAEEDPVGDEPAAPEGLEFARKLRRMSGIASPVRLPRTLPHPQLCPSGGVGLPPPPDRPARNGVGAPIADASTEVRDASTDPGAGRSVRDVPLVDAPSCHLGEQPESQHRRVVVGEFLADDVRPARPLEGPEAAPAEALPSGSGHAGGEDAPCVTRQGFPPGGSPSEGRGVIQAQGGPATLAAAGDASRFARAEGDNVPLIQQVGALYTLYALYRLQPGPPYSRLYIPLRALQEMTRVASEAHAAG
jgi:hypothetical protein